MTAAVFPSRMISTCCLRLWRTYSQTTVKQLRRLWLVWHEAAAEAGGVAAAAAAASTAAVARGAAEVALGARVAPLAAVSEVEGRADD